MSSPHGILKRLHTEKVGYKQLDPGDAGTIQPDRQFSYFPVVSGASGQTLTLADPDFAGQVTTVAMKTDGGGDITITADSAFDQVGNTSIVLGDVGDSITLVGIEDGSDLEWRTLAQHGIAISVLGFTLDDGENIAVGTSTGTEIGTAAAQKIGFHGATPVIQASAMTAGHATVTQAGTDSGDVAIQAAVQNTGYGFVDAAEFEAIVAMVRNNNVRMLEVENILEGKGFVAAN
jgi:hypothetical protein